MPLYVLMQPAGEEDMVESHWKKLAEMYVCILDLHTYIKVYRAPVHRAKSSVSVRHLTEKLSVLALYQKHLVKHPKRNC